MRGLADLSLSFCGIVDRGKGCVTSTNLQFDNRTSAVKVWHPPCTAGSIWSAVLPALFMVCGRDAILLNGVLLGANREIAVPGGKRGLDRGSAVLYLTCRLNTR